MSNTKFPELETIQKKHAENQQKMTLIEKIIEERERELLDYFKKNVKLDSKDGYFAEGIRLLFECAKYNIGTQKLQADSIMGLYEGLTSQVSIVDDIITILKQMDKSSPPSLELKFKAVSDEMVKLKKMINDNRTEIESVNNDMDDIFGSLARGKKGDIK